MSFNQQGAVMAVYGVLQVLACPEVVYPAEPGKMYTLCMVAPDSHLTNDDREYIHWMV